MARRGGSRVGRGVAWLLILGAAGAVAYGAWVYLRLPDVTVLTHKNPAATAFMTLRDLEYRRSSRTPPRRRQAWVPLRAISPHLVDAVLMAEDSAFYRHDGVDYRELWESLKLGWREKRLSRGASTITQQLAKNLYLSPDRTADRKLRELLIARRLESELGKRRILELYLNVAEWGRNIYGAEAASRAYFKVPAKDLTPAQSALLAGMLINPIRYSPLAPEGRLARRQRIILDRMVRYGRLSTEEYRLARGLRPATAETVVAAPIPDAPVDDGLADDERIAPPTAVSAPPPTVLIETPPPQLNETPPVEPTPELEPVGVPLAGDGAG
ncbi:MAG: monofunctional biosynthetic peptidoglycan transglycosylase [Nitrospiria bacterium]